MLRIDFSDVELCMLTHNESDVLKTTLPPLVPIFSKFSFLDQGSTDGTREIIHEILGDKATVAIEDKYYISKIGFAAARNKVSEMAVLPWMLHVDADELVNFPVGAVDLRNDGLEANAQYSPISRRNLICPTGAKLPISGAEAAELPTYSVEAHVRLYKNGTGIRWRSFIHEELWIGSKRLSQSPPNANLVLEHLSRFKGGEVGEKKENYYAWMMLEGAKKTEPEDMLSEYSLNILHERREYFTKRAKNFHEY